MLHTRILLLWPAFIVAAIATICFFSVFDPEELTLHGTRLFADNLGAYSVFFLCSWAFGTLNGALVLLLSRSERDVNGFETPPVDAQQYDSAADQSDDGRSMMT